MLLRKAEHTLKAIDYFTFDGFLFQYLFFFLTGKSHKRLAPDFGSYFSEMFDYMDRKKESVYFVGAKKEELQTFVGLIRSKYPNIKITGMHDGYFGSDDEPNLLSDIKKNSPDKIIVGLGTPKQEKFSVKVKKTSPDTLIFNCGAFISQTANHGEEYYPKWINQLNLRWIYRIRKEKGLFKRYFREYPKGIIYIIKDRFIL
ncbi:WecB/TagA/CpsF family glycosyltransferase [Aquimarina celericrescens]|uniref:WecB/TagA/CpsF family glycosyltransferase n=1 Tax=Aquimarina celericrescens TaxID=1964542 RepID=A0ABW5AVR9_9FLAO